MSIQSKGAILAAAAAVMALSMPVAFGAAHGGGAKKTMQPAGSMGAAIGATDKVHCYGVHSCKGNSDCKTAEHSCKGQNACGGHGFKAMGAKDCLDKGGVIADVTAK